MSRVGRTIVIFHLLLLASACSSGLQLIPENTSGWYESSRGDVTYLLHLDYKQSSSNERIRKYLHYTTDSIGIFTFVTLAPDSVDAHTGVYLGGGFRIAPGDWSSTVSGQPYKSPIRLLSLEGQGKSLFSLPTFRMGLIFLDQRGNPVITFSDSSGFEMDFTRISK